ncbi:MAG: hypothetical protein U9Q62_02120 [Campylobacterota bacterium]|nr:hypothetical protein [Campylobacterota bacterium]
MRIMRFLFFILFFSTALFATVQVHDTIIYQDKEYPLYHFPLDSYVYKKGIRHRDLFPVQCTAVWRGYVAKWKIIDDTLFLVALRNGECVPKPPEIPLSKLFPSQEGPIKATWYSGDLLIPEGEIIEFFNGYNPTYEKELWLKFENGVIIHKELHYPKK